MVEKAAELRIRVKREQNITRIPGGGLTFVEAFGSGFGGECGKDQK